jgi:flagellar biosynthetic protein FliP
MLHLLQQVEHSLLTLSLVAVLLAFPASALAAVAEDSAPMFQLSLAGGGKHPEQVSLGLEILFLLTVLSMAPAIILTVTNFTRIIIVFHFIRQSLGIQQLPPNQVLVSLAIFMTVAIMYPVGKEVNAPPAEAGGFE